MATEGNVRDVKFRANSDVTAAWVNGKLLYTWRDGETMSFNPALATPPQRQRAESFGFENTLRDSMALERDAYPDKKIPTKDKKAALRARIDHLQSGSPDWTAQPKARNTAPTEEEVATALMRVFKVDAEEAAGMIESLATKRGIDQDAAVAAWAAAKQVALEVVAIRAERRMADETPDAEAMLAELRG